MPQAHPLNGYVKTQISRLSTLTEQVEVTDTTLSTLNEQYSVLLSVDNQSDLSSEQVENQPHKKETTALLHAQVGNPDATPAVEYNNYPPQSQAKPVENETISRLEIGNLVFVTHPECETSQLPGRVTEVSFVTHNEIRVLIKISL